MTTIDTTTLITAGKMRSDCGDIRFTDSDGSTLINYWIESGQNTVSTKIWIKIPSISAGTNTIYVYYGNASATSASNGTNIFLFFDDFSYVDSISNHGWSIIQNSPVVESGWLKVPALNGNTLGQIVSVRTTNTFTNPFAIGFSYKFNSGGNQINLGLSQTTHLYDNINGICIDSVSNVSSLHGYGNIDTTFFVGSVNTPYSGSLVYKPNNTIDVTTNGYTGNLPTLSSMSTGTGSYIKIMAANFLLTVWIDYIYVRKYTSPEPTIQSISSEQTPSNITATNMTVTRSEIPCRVGICTVTVDVTWTNNGGISGDFIPNITIDGTPYSSPYPLQSLGPGISVVKTFIISGLAVGTRSICPYPN